VSTLLELHIYPPSEGEQAKSRNRDIAYCNIKSV